MKNLFQSGVFKLASGGYSNWKIECDALTKEDWATLAAMAYEVLPPFGEVVGVPRGGIPFANALRDYITVGHVNLLIAEDVVTTGKSINQYKDGDSTIGVCVFAREKCPDWITPLFRMYK